MTREGRTCQYHITGFQRVLIVVEHFLDSFVLEVKFISWNLDSSYWICPASVLESNSHYINTLGAGIFHQLSAEKTVQDKRAMRAFHWLTIDHSLSDPHIRCHFCNMRFLFLPAAMRSAESC